MKQFQVLQLTKTIGEKTLFENIQFTIHSGEKIGIVGQNGTGKTTLLSVLANEVIADEYEKKHPNDYTIRLLTQEDRLDLDLTIIETLFQSDTPLMRLNYEYEQVTRQLSEHPTDEKIQQRFTDIQAEMDAQGAWDMNTQARTILSKLHMLEPAKRVRDCSGGERKRVALAKVLLEESDLLLLDEPTNHLDIDSIEWLQTYLQQTKRAVLFITHDRYFLDEVATKIYELDQGKLYEYEGNYADFVMQKSEREQLAVQTAAKQQNRYRNELKWVMRGAKARSTKQKARLQRFDILKDDVLTKTRETELEMAVASTRLGKQVIEIESLAKSFGDRQLIEDFSALVKRTDRIAIVGPNGAGKSTLLKMIAGEEQPDQGTITIGQTVKMAHFHQHIPNMDTDERVINYIREVSNSIQTASGERLSATQMLERFLFPSHVHGTPIRKLSGGEKKRLFLLRLLMEEPNVLLLDEPTNDLDIETLTVLESFLDTFGGVVIVISHDRYFLDRTCTTLWALDGKGKVDSYYGLYSEYLAEPEEVVEVVKETKQEERPKERKKKMSYNEKREWETIEDDLMQLEEEIEQLNGQMEEAGSNYEQIAKLTEQLNEKNEALDVLLERWEYLEQLANEQ
ncbi:ABC-F family ATP-binding cassette domain-containing protein [Savagea sp. SN6]|uniref:ABC-F family ATP-binding cassette domain-containing protein n=1 Tax=Savagea serpentis TaxID=2785297 RepID=A0A8J7KDQ8_9BACL|nr:ABC-F family ATP-binding cassette domain-containing protein [Savagea serpentis]MBF4500336.1 ABC-F family ATP-binding cassette domain-containing protein [Savagea serpentis]